MPCRHHSIFGMSGLAPGLSRWLMKAADSFSCLIVLT